MKNVVSSYGPRIATVLSGGYDSRLMLSLAFNAGITPDVYVYGTDNSPDVLVAKSIANSESFKINHINKARHPKPTPDQYGKIVRDNFYAFDGYPAESIFDFGANMATRRERAKNDTLILNGGGGEIYRNFFYMPDGEYTVDQLLDVFYRRYTPDLCTGRFEELIYRDNLKRKIMRALRLKGEKMTRTQFEYAIRVSACVTGHPEITAITIGSGVILPRLSVMKRLWPPLKCHWNLRPTAAFRGI